MVAAWSSISTLTKRFCPVALSQYLSRQDWSTARRLRISQQSLALTAHQVCCSSLTLVVRLWDTLKDLLLNKLQRHKDSVYSVAFSPDGKFLVSGSLETSLQLWDLLTLNRDGNPPCNNTPPPLAAAKNNKNHLLSQQSQQQQNANTTSSTSGAGGANTAALHYVLSVAVSRDGKWISCKIHGVQFWDPKNRHGPVHVAGPQELGYLLGEQVNLLAKLPSRQAVYLLAKQVPAARRAG
ncbi:hypothetical protein PCASD_24748 [Puccinia coronata f. sp. avenae]|uniref:Uncharacterized protein n=1 Tax=Puccinia coronata f. sp. avenae TaxID=200324 RepID=A0A2N5TL82_9BASI|nr:hypothetical protein PCASD_24748 [Puccinia coronata f. sp. avenae]